MEQCLREGLPFPDKIANAPDLLPGLELYYMAFLELSNSRQMGMALGSIPWKVVQDYCETYEFDDEQTEAMHFHLREMDTAFLEHHRKKK